MRMFRLSLMMFYGVFVLLLSSQLQVCPAQADESLSIDQTRHGSAIRKVFEPIAEKSVHMVVEIEINETIVVTGTLFDLKRGLCVTKASRLGEFVTKDDLFRCHFANDRWIGAKFLGYVKDHDLVLLKCSPKQVSKLPPIKLQSELKTGQWVVSVGYADNEPLGVGVIGALPRRIPNLDGYVGLVVDQEDEGLTIREVHANSGAARAGLRSGDIILNPDRTPYTRRRTLSEFLSQFQPGDWFTLNASRGGEPLLFDVRVGTSWESMIARQSMLNRFGSDVSARRSGFPSVFQHDTLLHPKRCGGPVVNLEGELVGVNIARAGRTDTFSIPVELLLDTAKELGQ